MICMRWIIVMHLCRWNLHVEGGPVAVTVEKLMHEAEGSPRLMALTSLQLAKLVSHNPAILQFYTGVYIKMLLYGPSTNDNSFPGTALEVSYKILILDTLLRYIAFGFVTAIISVLPALDYSSVKGIRYQPATACKTCNGRFQNFLVTHSIVQGALPLCLPHCAIGCLRRWVAEGYRLKVLLLIISAKHSLAAPTGFIKIKFVWVVRFPPCLALALSLQSEVLADTSSKTWF